MLEFNYSIIEKRKEKRIQPFNYSKKKRKKSSTIQVINFDHGLPATKSNWSK